MPDCTTSLSPGQIWLFLCNLNLSSSNVGDIDKTYQYHQRITTILGYRLINGINTLLIVL